MEILQSPEILEVEAPFEMSPSLLAFFLIIDEGQITHLICARLKYDLYDFFRAVLGLLPALFLV